MPFQPAPNISQCELLFQVAGERVENSLKFSSDSVPSSGDLTNLGDVIITWWTTNLMALVSTEVQFVGVISTYLGSVEGPQGVSAPGEPLFGTRASPVLPNNVTWVIKELTAKIGRSFRGRIFHVGLAENEVNESSVIGSIAADLIIGYSALPGAVLGLGFTPVVLSRRHNNELRENGIGTQIIAYNYSDLTTDSQRPRLPNHRRKHTSVN